MTNIIFKRKIYDQLLQWKQEDDGSTAVLIKGPRRVGKSTIAEQFAKNEYKSYILIDFGKASKDVRNLFDDVSDLDYLFNNLQVMYRTQLTPRKSVIIFDEVQRCPNARQAIKYLVQDGRYDYIETGSLISIRKNVADIIIPSEEVPIDMNPLDYEEFRWALGDFVMMPLLRSALINKKPLSDVVNRQMMRDFRLYMLVGGMPQAVAMYVNTKSLARVDRVKRNIITLYESDFMKIDPSGTASAIFKHIPSELTSNSSRYQVTRVIEEGRASTLAETIFEMKESMVVNIAFHANDPSVGLPLHQDTNRYKIFVCDTGLFVTLAFWDKKFTDNTIYQKLLSDKLSADLGYVYENVVAQMLKAEGNELFYYTFPTESGKHNYEIDFILSDGAKITPIEVKSSSYKSHVSLDKFCVKFSSRINDRLIIYAKDLKRVGETTYLPVYMTPLLSELH
ncbi:MAG: ATP-binding protein [Muribaculaceae bacterium]|nr:ATP-binding protein [Muribaculaceae bacterium]